MSGNVREHPGRRRGYLCFDLVRRNLKKRLVAVDALTHLLQPAHDRAFHDRLAHLRHDDLCGHGLQMNGGAMDGVSRFAYRLGECGMGVNGALELLGGAFQSQRQYGF